MRISGIEIPNKKHILYALSYIKGIGLSTSKKICQVLDIALNTKACDITDIQRAQLESYISKNLIVGDDLLRLVMANIKKEKSIRSFRGKRITEGLPIKGSARSAGKTAKRLRQAGGW